MTCEVMGGIVFAIGRRLTHKRWREVVRPWNHRWKLYRLLLWGEGDETGSNALWAARMIERNQLLKFKTKSKNVSVQSKGGRSKNVDEFEFFSSYSLWRHSLDYMSEKVCDQKYFFKSVERGDIFSPLYWGFPRVAISGFPPGFS